MGEMGVADSEPAKRTRDADVRAVRPFSRNDAIGSAAVVAAAAIAGRLLHSSRSIARDARADLRAAE